MKKGLRRAQYKTVLQSLFEQTTHPAGISAFEAKVGMSGLQEMNPWDGPGCGPHYPWTREESSNQIFLIGIDVCTSGSHTVWQRFGGETLRLVESSAEQSSLRVYN